MLSKSQLQDELRLLQELDSLEYYPTGGICFVGWSPTHEGSIPETYACKWYHLSKRSETIMNPEKWQDVPREEKDRIVSQFNTVTVMLYPYPYEKQHFID